MKTSYFLTRDIEKVEMEIVSLKYRSPNIYHNDIVYVKYRIGNKPWKEKTLKAFNELALREEWIPSDLETIKMLEL